MEQMELAVSMAHNLGSNACVQLNSITKKDCQMCQGVFIRYYAKDYVLCSECIRDYFCKECKSRKLVTFGEKFAHRCTPCVEANTATEEPVSEKIIFTHFCEMCEEKTYNDLVAKGHFLCSQCLNNWFCKECKNVKLSDINDRMCEECRLLEFDDSDSSTSSESEEEDGMDDVVPDTTPQNVPEKAIAPVFIICARCKREVYLDPYSGPENNLCVTCSFDIESYFPSTHLNCNGVFLRPCDACNKRFPSHRSLDKDMCNPCRAVIIAAIESRENKVYCEKCGEFYICERMEDGETVPMQCPCGIVTPENSDMEEKEEIEDLPEHAVALVPSPLIIKPPRNKVVSIISRKCFTCTGLFSKWTTDAAYGNTCFPCTFGLVFCGRCRIYQRLSNGPRCGSCKIPSAFKFTKQFPYDKIVTFACSQCPGIGERAVDATTTLCIACACLAKTVQPCFVCSGNTTMSQGVVCMQCTANMPLAYDVNALIAAFYNFKPKTSSKCWICNKPTTDEVTKMCIECSKQEFEQTAPRLMCLAKEMESKSTHVTPHVPLSPLVVLFPWKGLENKQTCKRCNKSYCLWTFLYNEFPYCFSCTYGIERCNDCRVFKHTFIMTKNRNCLCFPVNLIGLPNNKCFLCTKLIKKSKGILCEECLKEHPGCQRLHTEEVAWDCLVKAFYKVRQIECPFPYYPPRDANAKTIQKQCKRCTAWYNCWTSVESHDQCFACTYKLHYCYKCQVVCKEGAYYCLCGSQGRKSCGNCFLCNHSTELIQGILCSVCRQDSLGMRRREYGPWDDLAKAFYKAYGPVKQLICEDNAPGQSSLSPSQASPSSFSWPVYSPATDIAIRTRCSRCNEYYNCWTDNEGHSKCFDCTFKIKLCKTCDHILECKNPNPCGHCYSEEMRNSPNILCLLCNTLMPAALGVLCAECDKVLPASKKLQSLNGNARIQELRRYYAQIVQKGDTTLITPKDPYWPVYEKWTGEVKKEKCSTCSKKYEFWGFTRFSQCFACAFELINCQKCGRILKKGSKCGRCTHNAAEGRKTVPCFLCSTSMFDTEGVLCSNCYGDFYSYVGLGENNIAKLKKTWLSYGSESKTSFIGFPAIGSMSGLTLVSTTITSWPTYDKYTGIPGRVGTCTFCTRVYDIWTSNKDHTECFQCTFSLVMCDAFDIIMRKGVPCAHCKSETLDETHKNACILCNTLTLAGFGVLCADCDKSVPKTGPGVSNRIVALRNVYAEKVQNKNVPKVFEPFPFDLTKPDLKPALHSKCSKCSISYFKWNNNKTHNECVACTFDFWCHGKCGRIFQNGQDCNSCFLRCHVSMPQEKWKTCFTCSEKADPGQGILCAKCLNWYAERLLQAQNTSPWLILMDMYFKKNVSWTCIHCASTNTTSDGQCPTCEDSRRIENKVFKRPNTANDDYVPSSYDPKSCAICYEQTINAAFVPCGHMMSCEPCAKIWIKEHSTCPHCRGKVTMVLRIYT